MIKKKVLLTAMSSVMAMGLLTACGTDDNDLNNNDDVDYRPVRYNQNNDLNRDRTDNNGILDDNDNDNRENNIFNTDRDNDQVEFDDNDLDLNGDEGNGNDNDRNGLGGKNGNMTGRDR